ncbi:MAG: sodium:proton antiporter NhaD [Bacteroidia bacterium]|jgi:Na+/H+ antiporter NhaD/arsenite permease-like protein|nr:sodium:proton antiporter NhaD [Bacteroidia bacterium]
MLLSILFLLGYAAIVLEHPLRLNKSASALITGVVCWTVLVLLGEAHVINEELLHQMGELSGILFFLLGAMTVVELIDAHDGFEVITSRITTTSKKRLFVVVGLTAFFLSAVLDNLTTAIVMMSLLRKLLAGAEDRRYFAGLVIIAANAGGAWSPIGDVTTTMLWVGGQITSANIILKLIIPSLVCLLVPMLIMLLKVKGKVERPQLAPDTVKCAPSSHTERMIVFATGIGVLLFVPVFKSFTHLPPFMGILLGVGVLWVVTEITHKRKNDEEKASLSVARALQRVDTPSVLFFLGILLAIGALQSAGLLTLLAQAMDNAIGNINVITMAIGVTSAVVDNVPLVAAAQGMYSLNSFPTDHYFWEFLAYCAGTGGSILIIGSAAGVAVMGLERIDFFWYVRRISFPALAGYFAGALVYMGMAALIHG